MARNILDDERIYLRLGYAMSKAQEMEIAMARIMEVQHQDLSIPFDDRWDEIMGWVRKTAGHLKDRLGVPTEVADDLSAAVGRRNRIAHEAWITYSLGESHDSADDWAEWFEQEASMLGEVVRGLAALREHILRFRQQGDDTALIRVWRDHVPNAVEPRPDR